MATVDIPQVGHVDGLDPNVYHAHPALSSSRVKLLVPPSTPAHYRWSLDHPVKVTREMLMGTATHTDVLGAGQGWGVIDDADRDEVEALGLVHGWGILPDGDGRTKPVRDAKAEIESAGRVPLKFADAAAAAFAAQGRIALAADEAERVRGMAAAVRDNEDAATLLRHGVPERAIFWRDTVTGVPCRGMIDWSPGRRSLVDLKTTGKGKARRDNLPRLIDEWAFDIQASHYLRGATALDLIDGDAQWVWIIVEREPPHPVAVAVLDTADLANAHDAVSAAYRLLADCIEADYWPSAGPGYPTGIQTVTLPPWSRRDIYTEEFEPSW